MKQYVTRCFLALALLGAGCGGDEGDTDAGSADGGETMDAEVPQCARDSDCEDELFCTEYRCAPGAAGANARGCVLTDGPCDPGMSCNEDMDRCEVEECTGTPDADEDGHDSVACGGDDCDDDDPNRYPGNAEVCDDAGHDEDCVDDTFAGADDGDADGDGFVDAMCCNGPDCGDDCDDEDRATFPGARELCNGRDDDCDGSMDETGGDVPLCPGGVCTAGRCDLEGWARTFGGASDDFANAVAMDDLGNVYITGAFLGSASFGGSGGPEMSVLDGDGAPTTDIFVASYGPDGSYRWVETFGSAGNEIGFDIAFDPVSEMVFFTGAANAPIDFGGGPVTSFAFLVALDRDGGYVWDREFDLGTLSTLTVDAYDGPVVAGAFTGTKNFGGSDRSAVATTELVVARYGADRTHSWDFVSNGTAGASIRPRRVSIDRTGRVAVAGEYAGADADFGAGARPHSGNADVFAVALTPGGSLDWDYWAGASGEDTAVAMRFDDSGNVFIVGAFEGTVDFGGGDEMAPAAQSAFLLRLDSAGAFGRVRTWGGGDTNDASSVAIDSSGNVLVSGTFSGSVNFGGGLTSAPPAGAAYLVTYDADFNHRSDRSFTYPGYPGGSCPTATCRSEARDLVIGPADSTALAGAFEGVIDLGTGARTSEGSSDGFVIRLAN